MYQPPIDIDNGFQDGMFSRFSYFPGFQCLYTPAPNVRLLASTPALG